MNKTVVALYDNFSSANNAVGELVDRGFAREEISLIAPEQTDDIEYREESSPTKEGAAVGAGVGATWGGIGGLLVGAGSLFVPGIGPVLAAGPLVSILASTGVGAAVGGVTGGLLGALVSMSVPEEKAHSYAEGVRRGGTLVTVRTTDDQAGQVVQILNWYDPVNIDQRMGEWRQSGWTGFDTDSGPYSDTGEVEYQDDADLPDDEYVDDDIDLVDEYETDSSPEYRDFDEYEPLFREHFEMSRYGHQYTYDQFRPAYYYGYSLAVDQEYQDRDWEDVEPEARRNWEDLEPGTWDRFKETVRAAWEDVKEAVR